MDLGKIIKSQQIVKGFRVVQKTKMWATLMCTVWCCCIEQSPYSCCILGTEPALLAVKPSHSQHTSCCLYRWTAAVSVPRMLYILRNMPKYTQDKKWSIASSMVGGEKRHRVHNPIVRQEHWYWAILLQPDYYSSQGCLRPKFFRQLSLSIYISERGH